MINGCIISVQWCSGHSDTYGDVFSQSHPQFSTCSHRWRCDQDSSKCCNRMFTFTAHNVFPWPLITYFIQSTQSYYVQCCSKPKVCTANTKIDHENFVLCIHNIRKVILLIVHNQFIFVLSQISLVSLITSTFS